MANTASSASPQKLGETSLGCGRGSAPKTQGVLFSGMAVAVANTVTPPPTRKTLLKESTETLLGHIGWLTANVKKDLQEVSNANQYCILLAQFEAHSIEVQKHVLKDVRYWRHRIGKEVETGMRDHIHQSFIPIAEMLKSERAMAQEKAAVDPEDVVWVTTRLRRHITELWGLANMSPDMFSQE